MEKDNHKERERAEEIVKNVKSKTKVTGYVFKSIGEEIFIKNLKLIVFIIILGFLIYLGNGYVQNKEAHEYSIFSRCKTAILNACYSTLKNCDGTKMNIMNIRNPQEEYCVDFETPSPLYGNVDKTLIESLWKSKNRVGRQELQ